MQAGACRPQRKFFAALGRAALSTCRPGFMRSDMTEGAFVSITRRRCMTSSIPDVRIARHLTTNAEWLEFIEAGGYTTPSLWLSDGWAAVQPRRLAYWRFFCAQRAADGDSMTLAGLKAYRSGRAGDACQLLRGRRLCAVFGRALADRGGMGSGGARRRGRRRFRHPWQWTRSDYRPYPGFRAAEGRSANITASSWSARWCCAAARWRRRRATRASAIAISSIPAALAVHRAAARRIQLS